MMNNPYIKEISKYYNFDKNSIPSTLYWQHYDGWQQRFAFAIPSEPAVKFIASYSPICEVGAGNGYWAYMLNQVGCDIIAYDTHPVPTKDNHFFPDWVKPWHTVHKCDDDFVPPSNRALFMCWPPYDDSMAIDTLKRYEGDTLIYIGEDEGGCTATDEFYIELDTWNKTYELNIPQFFGLHDYISIYERN